MAAQSPWHGDPFSKVLDAEPLPNVASTTVPRDLVRATMWSRQGVAAARSAGSPNNMTTIVALGSLALSLLLSVAWPSSGAAQDVPAARTREAEQLFTDGLRLAQQDRWAEALELFRRSDAVVELPATVLNMGRCLLRLGRAREALGAVERFRRMGSSTPVLEAMASEIESEGRGRLATLELAVVPEHAEVLLDGSPEHARGAVRRILLDPGDHQIAVSAEGHRAQRFRIHALPGERLTREVALQAAAAVLVVVSNVGSAAIVVDGAERGNGRATLELLPGRHRIRVTADGHHALDRVVELDPGQRLELDAALEPVDRGGGLLASPIFWIITGVVAVGAGVAVGVVAFTGTDPPYGGTTGIIISLDAP